MNYGRVNESQVKYYARAKYYLSDDGVRRLAKVQEFSFPAFRRPGFELEGKDFLAKTENLFNDAEEKIEICLDKDEHSSWRALQRAKINAFDKILCNPDLDTFATFTISPEAVSDRSNYTEIYSIIRKWFENRVQRKGLKYIICPERHKLGGIHFHAIMNSIALKLIPATNAHTGQPLYHNGQPLYNISDWPYGFTSAELIHSATLDREKVAKYIFKYMGKQGIEGKIGGRYSLIGGKLNSPIYLYGISVDEFILDSNGYYREATHGNILYREWSFV